MDDNYNYGYDPGYGNNYNNDGNNNNHSSGNTLKIVLITLVSVLIVLVIIVGAVLLLRGSGTKEDTGAPNAAADSAESIEHDTTVADATTAVVDQPAAVPETVAPTAPATAPPVTTTAPAPSNAPNLQYSYPSPRISWASTERGTVLSESNVNSARSFGADQAIDGYANTCWCVNTNNNGGAGGTITIHLAETSYVSGISLINGNIYLPGDGIYKSNGQVKDFTLTFSDGSSVRYTATFNYASTEYQTFRFANPVITDTITLRVDSGYVGQKYTTNVCIGEIGVF